MHKYQTMYPSTEYADFRELLSSVAEKYPDSDAFIVKRDKTKKEYTHITYSKFQADVNRLGTALLHTALPRRRVAIIGKNSYEWMLTFFALLCGGTMAVPLDKGLSEEEIFSLLARSESDCIFFDKEYYETIKAFAGTPECAIEKFVCMDDFGEMDRLSDLLEEGEEKLRAGDKAYANVALQPEEAGIMLFTSGTTARSKAVLLCQKNILANVYGMSRAQRFYPTDVNMAFLPYHHTFGSVGTIIFIAHGATTVFCDGIRYIAQNLEEYGVTVFVCVPLIIEGIHKKIMHTVKKQGKEKTLALGRKISRLLLAFGIDKRRSLFKDIHNALGGKVRYIISGASALSPEIWKAFNDFGLTTVQGYGLTETAPVISAENIKMQRSGSVGLPLCNVEVKIDNPDSRGIGEILAKGPNVMLGYYLDEEATNEVIRDGWFHTGDLGRLDKDGVLYITGRKKNVIVLKNGKNIYPEEMETVINALPYVDESLVFGKEKGDDFIVSVKIVYNKDYFAGQDSDAIEKTIRQGISEVNDKMAKHQYIKHIEITDQPMEKTTTAKIKRYKAV